MGRDITSTFNAWSYTLNERTIEVFTQTGNEIPQNGLEITLPRIVLGAGRIWDISENVNIKITDIEGNLVAEAQSNTNPRYSGYNLEIDGGTAYWNGKNLGNNTVSSGVYLIMLSDLDTFETKVLKLMVVR